MEQPKVEAHHGGGENRRRDGLSHLDARSRPELHLPLQATRPASFCNLDYTPHYESHLVYGNPEVMVVLLMVLLLSPIASLCFRSSKGRCISFPGHRES